MFGFVVANPEKLSEEQKKHYRAVYCGLCEDLGVDRGFRYRMALTYDLVFLAIVLSSVMNEEYEEYDGRCPVYPTKKRKYLRNKYTRYAADMNIALAYYKYIDDWNDDGSRSALAKARCFEKEAKTVFEKYPECCAEIEKCLNELSQTEKDNVLIPDVPAAQFGRLLGKIFEYGAPEYGRQLYEFGFSLGKFIYILDAAADLKSDIKKKRYNPLVRCKAEDAEPILRMIMAECVEKYKSLPVNGDREIIENILLSGVWTSFDTQMKGKKSE